MLYNLIERDIGLPLSKEVRQQSRVQAKSKASEREQTLSAPVAKNSRTMTDQEIVSPRPSEDGSAKLLEKILSQCGDCKTLKRLLNDHLN